MRPNEGGDSGSHNPEKRRSQMRGSRVAVLACAFGAVSVVTGCSAAVDGSAGEATGTSESAISVVEKVPVQIVQIPPYMTEGLITFDDVPSGTAINTHYAGVTFDLVTGGSNGIVSTGGNVFAMRDMENAPAVSCIASIFFACPRSGNDVTTQGPPVIFPAFSGQWGGIRATFASGKTSVSILTRPMLGDESLGAVNNLPYLEAFDPSGAFIPNTTAYYPVAYGNSTWGTWQTLTVVAPAGQTIGSVIFATQASSGVPVFAEFDTMVYQPR
jgi:hypothetical protein